MRVGILETVKTRAGFELEYDRLIIDELKNQGHEPILLLPENSSLEVDFGIPVEYLSGGEIVSYEGMGKIRKLWGSVQREVRRVKWFNSACDIARDGKVDIILITTATYRYLRSLHKSRLKNSPVPVVFMFLGVNPQERPKFLKEAYKCNGYKNIKLKITSLRDDFKNENVSNLVVIPPPVLVPLEIQVEDKLKYKKPIQIGFFGHYRKGEKDIDGILEAFVNAKVEGKAELVVQAAPTTIEDKTDLDEIMKRYKEFKEVKFIEGRFSGKQWYELLQSVDVIFLPYSSPRYIYNWSAVYFNALGLFKPVLVTDILNPEVMAQYNVGKVVNVKNKTIFSEQIYDFINDYKEQLPVYADELHTVNNIYSTRKFILNLLE